MKQDKHFDIAILGLAHAEFKMGNLTKAERLLRRYQALNPMQSSSHNLLGDIYRSEKRFKQAAEEYKHALSLGASDKIDIIIKLLKISKYIAERENILKYIIVKYRDFKKRFYRGKKR